MVLVLPGSQGAGGKHAPKTQHGGPIESFGSDCCHHVPSRGQWQWGSGWSRQRSESLVHGHSFSSHSDGGPAPSCSMPRPLCSRPRPRHTAFTPWPRTWNWALMLGGFFFLCRCSNDLVVRSCRVMLMTSFRDLESRRFWKGHARGLPCPPLAPGHAPAYRLQLPAPAHTPIIVGGHDNPRAQSGGLGPDQKDLPVGAHVWVGLAREPCFTHRIVKEKQRPKTTTVKPLWAGYAE